MEDYNMNKELGKKVAKTAVNLASKTAKMPNQFCLLFLGKPNSKIDISVNDYENLEDFIKSSSN